MISAIFKKKAKRLENKISKLEAKNLQLQEELNGLQALAELVQKDGSDGKLVVALEAMMNWASLLSYQCIIHGIETPAIKEAGDKAPFAAQTLADARARMEGTDEAL